jgi:hypothetical protein
MIVHGWKLSTCGSREYSLQTPVYALYAIPTLACASIFLATRTLQIALPSSHENAWYTLFDADLEDIMSCTGYIMRLYRKRSMIDEERWMRLTVGGKKELRAWLQDHAQMGGE